MCPESDILIGGYLSIALVNALHRATALAVTVSLAVHVGSETRRPSQRLPDLGVNQPLSNVALGIDRER